MNPVKPDLEKITDIISEIEKNKSKPKIYQNHIEELQKLLSQGKQNTIKLSLKTLEKSFFSLLTKELFFAEFSKSKQKDTKLMHKIAETVYYIFNAFVINNQIDEQLKVFANNTNHLNSLLNIINQIPIEYTNILLLFLNAYEINCRWIATFSPKDLEVPLNSLILFADKHKTSNKILKYILNIIQTLIKDNYREGLKQLKKDSSFLPTTLSTLISIIISTTDQETVVKIIQVIILILETESEKAKNHMRQKELIKMFVYIKERFNKDDMVDYYLSRIIELTLKEGDLEGLLTLMINQSIDSKLQDKSLMKQIKDYHKDKEVVTSIILLLFDLLSKKRVFAMQLNEVNNALNYLFKILKEKYLSKQITDKEMKPTIRLLSIIYALVMDYDFLLKPENVKIFTEICHEFAKTLFTIVNNKVLTKSLLKFFTRQDNKALESCFSVFNYKDTEKLFVDLLKIYYDKKWLYAFFYRFNLSVIYKKKYGVVAFFTEDNTLIRKLLDQNELSEGDKKKLIDMCEILTVKLLLKPGELELIDTMLTTAFTRMANTIIKIFITETSEADGGTIAKPTNSQCLIENTVENEDNYISIITLLFAIIERKSKVVDNDNSKCQPFFEFLYRLIMFKSISYKTIAYLLNKIMNLYEKKEENLIKCMVINPSILNFILYTLRYLSNEDHLDQKHYVLMDNILNLFSQMVNIPSQFKLFLNSNGMDLIIDLIARKIPHQNKSLSILVDIFKGVTQDNNMMQVIAFYSDEWTLLSILSSIESIKVSEGINEMLYKQLLQLTKELLEKCNDSNIQAIEDSNIIGYLIKEFIVTYSHYVDPQNELLIIQASILAILSHKKGLLRYLVDTSLFDLIEKIMMEIERNKDIESLNLFNQLVLLIKNLISAKSHSLMLYEHSKTKNIIKLIQRITISKAHIIDFDSMILFFESLILIEKNQIKNECSINQEYLTNLHLKVNELNTKDTASITNCIEKMIHQVNRGNNEDNKHQNRFKGITVNQNIMQDYQIILTSIEEESVNKKQAKCICYNKALKDYYTKIMYRFNELLKIIPEKSMKKEDIELENIEMDSLIQIIINFIEENDNLKLFFVDGLIEKMIIIIDNSRYFSSVINIAYSLFDKAIDNPITVNYFFSHDKISQHFFKEFHKILQNSSSEIIQYLVVRTQVISKIIVKLTEDTTYLKNNMIESLLQDLIKALGILKSQNTILINYLSIMKSIFIVSPNKYLYDKELSQLFTTLWTHYHSEPNVLIQIMNLIEIKKDSPIIINACVINGILAKYQREINEKGKIEKVQNVLIKFMSLIIILHKHKPLPYEFFSDSQNLLSFCEKYIANEELTNHSNLYFKMIIEENPTIYIDRNYKDISLCRFCIKFLQNYLATNNLNLFELFLDMIIILIKENHYRIAFSNPENFIIILQSVTLKLDYVEIITKYCEIFNTLIQCFHVDDSESSNKDSGININSLHKNISVLLSNICQISVKYRSNANIMNIIGMIIRMVCQTQTLIDLKQNFFGLIFPYLDYLVDNEKIEELNCHLSYINELSSDEFQLLNNQCIKFIDVCQKIIETLIPQTYQIPLYMLEIIYIIVSNNKNIQENDFPEIKQIAKILIWVKNHKQYSQFTIIENILKIIESLCSIDNTFFQETKHKTLFVFIIDNTSLYIESSKYVNIIKLCANIAKNYLINTQEEANQIALVFYEHYTKVKASTKQNEQSNQVLFSIIEVLGNKYKEKMKIALISEASEVRKEYKKNNLDNASKSDSFESRINRIFASIDKKNIDEIRDFLIKQSQVKLHNKDNKNELVTLSLDQTFKILHIDSSIETHEPIVINQIDSIIKITQQSSKASYFSTMAKLENCFCITVKESDNIEARYINIECYDEITCNKYIDYLLQIIHDSKIN